jgi:hypothetical protein
LILDLVLEVSEVTIPGVASEEHTPTANFVAGAAGKHSSSQSSRHGAGPALSLVGQTAAPLYLTNRSLLI